MQQKKPRKWWPDPKWKTLDCDSFTIECDGSSVLIGGLDYDSDYRHRVRTLRGGQTSEWSEEHDTKVPLPFLGHQADHTVKYRIGVMPTPAPNVASSVDPGVVIPTAIPMAVAAWNNAVATPSPHVLFCEGDACTVNNADRNTDGRDVTVEVESGGLGKGIATVKPRSTSAGWADDNDHINDLEMVIEEPARQPDPFNPSKTLRIIWTNDTAVHGKKVDGSGGSSRYYYLPTVVMHEFGHAAGLEDLYLLDDGHLCRLLGICTYSGYIMGNAEKETTIPSKDKEYLRDVYRDHDPHATAAP